MDSYRRLDKGTLSGERNFRREGDRENSLSRYLRIHGRPPREDFIGILFFDTSISPAGSNCFRVLEALTRGHFRLGRINDQALGLPLDLARSLHREYQASAKRRVGAAREIFLVIGRPHRGKEGISGGGFREKTSMQMDQPLEFSRHAYARCVCARKHGERLPRSLSFSVSPVRPDLSALPLHRSSSFVFVYGHVERRIRGGERPSFPREAKLRGN